MRHRPLLLAAAVLASAAAHAQPAPATNAGDELRRMCSTVTLTPADGREMAKRSECVLAGVIPSSDRLGEARELARGALARGEPAGGLLLYLAFQDDPANQYVRDGQSDEQAYERLAARPVEQRGAQIEAIEGLGIAAGKNNRTAGMLLASYFHDTVAPMNVVRVDALTSLLMRGGDKPPVLERMAGEAAAIRRAGGATKASVRAFFQAHQQAVLAAVTGYTAQAGSGSCTKPTLKSVSSGDIVGAEYLPLKGTLVADSYLMRGEWSEFWLFQGCGQEIPVTVSFSADGWGGSHFTAIHNKGG